MAAKAASIVQTSGPVYSDGRAAVLFAPDDRLASENTDQIPRVLLVEDEYLVATHAQVALAEAGFAVVGIAASAEEAIALARSHEPELVIMDIRLAGTGDGMEAALDLYRLHGIRCIFATAHNEEAVRRRAAPAKPLGWLPKPYSMEALIKAAKQAISELRKGQ